MSLVRFLTIPPLFKAGMLSREGVWLDRMIDRFIREDSCRHRETLGVRALVSMLARKVVVSVTGVFATL